MRFLSSSTFLWMIAASIIAQPKMRQRNSIRRCISLPRRPHTFESKVSEQWSPRATWLLQRLCPLNGFAFHRKICCIVAILGYLRRGVHPVCHYFSVRKASQQGRTGRKRHRSESRAVSADLKSFSTPDRLHLFRFFFSFLLQRKTEDRQVT